ncbi:MAG: hypothetical protein LBP53_03920 [Candidatus Peribacteria bacterium]|nr:hypothetical protein [Candidatus Peribacteria bacterium]
MLLTVIIGFVWQGLKLWKPDFFASLGYELKLDDFQFGSKPPLYYLTGYEGILRRQGLFAGPNNYGYFLIAFFPLILLFSTPLGTMGKGRKVRRTSLITLPLVQQIPTLLLFLRIAAMLMTLSRAVIVGGVIVLLLCYRQQIKKLKKPVLGGILG